MEKDDYGMYNPVQEEEAGEEALGTHEWKLQKRHVRHYQMLM